MKVSKKDSIIMIQFIEDIQKKAAVATQNRCRQIIWKACREVNAFHGNREVRLVVAKVRETIFKKLREEN